MIGLYDWFLFFFSSRRRHTRYWRDWSSDVCSSDLTSIPKRFTGEDGKARISHQQERTRAGRGWSLAIGDARTAEALGCIVLMLRPQAGVAGLGYWLVPEARGRGYATRAVTLLTAWGLEAETLGRIEA